MVTDADQFWSGPQGAARFKHAVVRSQVGAFAGKLGHARRRAISYIDGYAGPGAYDDGSPGSPMIVLEIADELKGSNPPIQLNAQFIEKKRAYRSRLERLLQERGYPEWPVLRGDCRKRLPEALARTADDPLLLFLDPFGLGVPFSMLVELVLSRDSGVAGRKLPR